MKIPREFLIVFLAIHLTLAIFVKPIPTDNGLVIGASKVSNATGKIYYAYQGIPYAQPPLGSLRFQAPLPAKKWASKLFNDSMSLCIENNMVQGKKYSEDCLYLDVYTPSPTGNSAVVVYIFGEGFTSGQNIGAEAGPDYFLEKNIVYVTFRYRLGIFGFLSTADMAAPGNNGLKDMVKALEWVKKNIKGFGGNPNKVTVAGVGSAATAVSLLQMSDIVQKKNLFSSVILQSGSAYSPWSISKKSKTLTYDIAKQLKINTTSSTALVKELQTVEAQTLQDTFYNLWKKTFEQDPLDDRIIGPVFEPEQSPNAILKVSRSTTIANVHTLIGYTSEEGNNEDISDPYTSTCVLYDFAPNYLIPTNMNITGFIKRFSIGSKIKWQYYGILPVCFQYYQRAKLFGDLIFVRPAIKTAKMLSEKSRVYLYKYSYSGKQNIVNSKGDLKKYKGAPHYAELPSLFHFAKNDSLSENDVLIRNRMTTLWSNFISLGSPTKTGEPLQWPSFNSTGQSYLDINQDIVTKQNPDKDTVDFWDNLYEKN